MILLVTMAGRDKQFESEGYRTPKYLLPWGDGTILSAILDEFLRHDVFTDVRLVANASHEAYLPHVRAILRARGIGDDQLSLTEDTHGQAATALLGLDAVAEAGRASADAPVLITNVDTILLGRDLPAIANTLRSVDGFVDIFRSSDRSYSYVLLDERDRVKEIAEKIVVSDVATSGCYGFRNADTYRQHADAAQDIYISGVFKRMLADGCTVIAGDRHSEDDTIVLNTPEQYVNAGLVRL